jgi:hypothetical protein
VRRKVPAPAGIAQAPPEQFTTAFGARCWRLVTTIIRNRTYVDGNVSNNKLRMHKDLANRTYGKKRVSEYTRHRAVHVPSTCLSTSANIERIPGSNEIR